MAIPSFSDNALRSMRPTEGLASPEEVFLAWLLSLPDGVDVSSAATVGKFGASTTPGFVRPGGRDSRELFVAAAKCAVPKGRLTERQSEERDMTAGSAATNSTPPRRSLLERLKNGPVICAEGYLFELERRGYLQAGAFVPEAVIENPEVVRRLHEDFVHAGSDVVEAFTYYAHRQKLKVIGRENILEEMNRQALRIARDVADRARLPDGWRHLQHQCLRGRGQDDARDRARNVRGADRWAVEEKADFLIAETIDWCGEAEIALDVMKRSGLPAVVTLSVHRDEKMFDGVPVVEALKRLEGRGRRCRRLNCQRGPKTLMPIVRRVREAVSCHVAALPVPYRDRRRRSRHSRL